MKPFEFYFPTKIIMGEGKLKELGKIARGFGQKIFFLYDPFLKDSSTLADIKRDFETQQLTVIEFNDVEPNPRNTTIDAGKTTCITEACDLVVAIGGGSAIDSAKAIALSATNGGNCWDYTERADEKVTRPTKEGLPLIVVPTTAGTGTEATSYAVINNPKQKRKCTIISDFIYPDVSLIDPTIMQTIPPMLTALTGIDTFAHAVESYISVNATPISEMLSLQAVKLFAKSISRAVHDGENDIEARNDMAFACSLAGAAIGMAGTTLPHALGQPLGALTDAPHGGTLAACFPQVMAWTLPAASEKLGQVAEILNPSLADEQSSLAKAQELPMILNEFYRNLGVDVSFGKYGLKEDEIEQLTDLCFAGFSQDMKAHPKQARRDDLVELIHACM